MKIKHLVLATLACLVTSTIAMLLWASNRSQGAPDVFAEAGGKFERERILFNVNARGTTQSTWWSATASFEELVESVKSHCSPSSGWVYSESSTRFEVSRKSGSEAILVSKQDGGRIQVSLHGDPSKADYWAEWIRTRGQIRVYDPMNIGLFRKPGPLPTAKGP